MNGERDGNMDKIRVKEIQRLTYADRVNEYLKLAKRANTRIDALKKQGLLFESKATKDINGEKFSRSKKFKDKKSLNKAIAKVVKFLNNPTSTTSGTKKHPVREPETYKLADLRTVTKSDKIKLSQKWSKIANRRISELDKAGIDYYAREKLQYYFDVTKNKKNRFYTGKNWDSEVKLNRQLHELSLFLRAKTSTVAGVKQIRATRNETFNKRFEARGIDFRITPENEKMFYDFLSSEQFTSSMRNRVASNQIIDDFARAIDDGETPEQIYEEYSNFLMNHSMTFEQIAETRRGKTLLK